MQVYFPLIHGFKSNHHCWLFPWMASKQLIDVSKSPNLSWTCFFFITKIPVYLLLLSLTCWEIIIDMIFKLFSYFDLSRFPWTRMVYVKHYENNLWYTICYCISSSYLRFISPYFRLAVVNWFYSWLRLAFDFFLA